MVVPATIDNTLGALFIVVIITSILYGAGLIQCWIYFQNKPKGDHWSLALLVASVTILDTVQQGLICHAVYGYAVTGHGDPTSMLKMQKTIMIELFFGGALALLYCWRIWKLSKSGILAIFVSLPSWTYFILTYVYTSLTMDFESLAELIKQKRLATTLNIFGAVSDLVITVIMLVCLHRTKTQFKRTTDLLNRLIFMACSTGIPTTLCSIADVICLNTMPQTFIYMGFFLIMDRLYTNCLLVTFNARDYIRNGANGFSSMEMTVTMPELASNPGDEERDIDVRGSKFV